MGGGAAALAIGTANIRATGCNQEWVVCVCIGQRWGVVDVLDI